MPQTTLEAVESETEIPKKILILQNNDRKQLMIKYCNNNNIIMEYKKMINLIDYTQNELSKCCTKKCLEINDDL